MIWLCCLLLVGTSSSADDFDKLVSVVVLFRHGARAPADRLSNQSHAKFFSNGLGELSNIGIESSYALGKFLGQRYVTSGFLRSPLLPQEVYFRSRANDRCLMTASLVGSGMFDVDGVRLTAMVPIYSQEKGDTLLTATNNCTVETKRIFATCGRTPKPSYKNFTEFEGFIYECLGLHNRSQLFRDGKSFEIVDSLINEYQNGLPMPEWFESHKKEIFDNFMKVENFIIGAAEYHDDNILRLKCGFILHTVLEQLKSNWQRFVSDGVLKTKKFIAYSTQDWLLQCFMDLLGIRNAAQPDSSLPNYNSLIILELRALDGIPVVKAFFRDPVQETLSDVTRAIRGCDNCPLGCPLSQVLNCCDSYITANPTDECFPELPR